MCPRMCLIAAIRLVFTLDPNIGRTVQCAGTWWTGHARGHRGAFDRRTRAGETGTALGVVGDHPSTAERVCACLSEQQQVDVAGAVHLVGHLRTSFLVFPQKFLPICLNFFDAYVPDTIDVLERPPSEGKKPAVAIHTGA
jgi:hypothetical protein